MRSVQELIEWRDSKAKEYGAFSCMFKYMVKFWSMMCCDLRAHPDAMVMLTQNKNCTHSAPKNLIGDVVSIPHIIDL